jgi:glutaminyl-tRNA synthetase
MATTDIKHFIEQIIENDLASNTYNGAVVTRFPPEPNGYLHIGHAKSICLNFAMASQYNGYCNLRFDDTNPVKEDLEFVTSIQEDVLWLGFQWHNKFYASDYFPKMYEIALEFINKGLAYVCSLNGEQIRQHRGTLTEPGTNSPYRLRSVAENLDLFNRMHNGEFAEGTHVLRAKIDMASGNINLRDPIMYRILHKPHQHVGDAWCIYPMYDYAHCFSDYFENITHSLCTLEFQDHRPLYNWYLEQIYDNPKPQQIEFAKLNLSHTLLSKRNLKRMVDEKMVDGWDDPRMPTLVGLRRRGFTPEAIKNFCSTIGVTKSDSLLDVSLFEQSARDHLNQSVPRIMCVINPLKVTITNLTATQHLNANLHPQVDLGARDLVFSNTLYIEQDDFMETSSKDFFRLSLNGEVRLRYSYILKCNEVVKDHDGKIIELLCTIDNDTLGKNPEGRKVKGVIHWVDASSAKSCEVRLYERLFSHEAPNSADGWDEVLQMLNPNSCIIKKDCFVETNIPNLTAETRYQFERLGYFVIDRHDASADNIVFNRIIGLRDSK